MNFLKLKVQHSLPTADCKKAAAQLIHWPSNNAKLSPHIITCEEASNSIDFMHIEFIYLANKPYKFWKKNGLSLVPE